MLDIKALHALLMNEVNTELLQPIDKNIYSEIADALASMKGQGYEGLEARIRDSLVLLISDITDTLLRVRLGKYDTNKSNLTYEELYIINADEEYKLREDFVIKSILEGRSKVLEGIRDKVKTKRIAVRIINDVEEFVGADNTKYGAYKREDIAVLPLEDAKRLIDKGDAIELIIQD
jgi:DNA replication factor GINS